MPVLLSLFAIRPFCLFLALVLCGHSLACASEGSFSKAKERILQQSEAAVASKTQAFNLESTTAGKFTGPLRALIERNGVPGEAKLKGPLTKVPFVETDDANRVHAYIYFEEYSEAEGRELASLGVDVEVVNESLNIVQAWIPYAALADVQQNSMVKRLTAPDYATANQGAFVTEGKAILQSAALLQKGFTGKGVKVGILSDGATQWTSSRASGDLPANFRVFGSCTNGVDDIPNCRFERTCNEGTAMAEIIHDLAPEAEIAVYSVATSMDFINGLTVLSRDFEADIIVDDLGFFGEPYFYDGPIAQAVDALPSRVLYVSSAGNSAARHYDSQQYNPWTYDNPFTGRIETVHSFNNSSQFDVGSFYHGLAIRPDSAVRVIMQWEQRSPTFNRGFDFGMVGYDQSGGIVDVSNFNNLGFDYGLEFLCLPNTSTQTTTNFVSLFQDQGSRDTNFKIYFLGASGIEFPEARGSIFGHPSLERAIAVGAINASDAPGQSVTFYSSQGPSQFNVFNETTRTLTKTFRSKPDVVSVDGVSVSGAGGFPTQFFGTSASAPHVAGLAAQLMSVSSRANANNVRRAIESGTIDMESPGFDFLSGNGQVSAPLALKALRLGTPIPAIILLLDE